MPSGQTNRGKYLQQDIVFRGATPPTNFFVALVTNAVVPSADTNTFDELTEIPAGNGYTAGGIQLNRNSTDFDVLTEDDSGDRSFIQVKDLVWTASGGPLPSSGSAYYAILIDDEVTPNVWAYWDLGGARQVSNGQPLTVQNCELRNTE